MQQCQEIQPSEQRMTKQFALMPYEDGCLLVYVLASFIPKSFGSFYKIHLSKQLKDFQSVVKGTTPYVVSLQWVGYWLSISEGPYWQSQAERGGMFLIMQSLDGGWCFAVGVALGSLLSLGMIKLGVRNWITSKGKQYISVLDVWGPG